MSEIHKIIEIEVLRYKPESDEAPHPEIYKVPFTDDMSVLQGAQYIKDNFDGSLTFRWSCRMAICGSCGMMINGIPKLSCETFLCDYYPNRISIEALAHFPIEKDLVVEGFVLRYRTQSAVDGLPTGEGAFLACSFWLADNYVLLGRHDEARALFQRLVSLCNDVGLLAEEYDPKARRQVGNFPQAFSHIALINTAYNLHRVSGPAAKRAQEEGADGR